MSDKLSHEEYVLSVRRKVAEVCSGMLARSIPVLEGCQTLSSLREGAEVGERDADFEVFALVASETEGLPVGEVRKHWAAGALRQSEQEIQSAVEWAEPLVFPACKAIIGRFEVQEP